MASSTVGLSGTCRRSMTIARLTSVSTSMSRPRMRRNSTHSTVQPRTHPGYIPLSTIEKFALTVGSGMIAYVNPRRGDLVAAFGELTAYPYFLPALRDRMLADKTGRRILRERPRISSSTISLDHLASLPPNTIGHHYYSWLQAEKLEQDNRTPVRFIEDEECAYVMQRYRESHDFYHAITGLPTVREGEVALKAFEYANTGLPMTGLASLAVFTMKQKERDRFWSLYGPWAIRNGARAKDLINVYWEEHLDTDVDIMRARLGIERPPDMRELRRAARQTDEAKK